MIDKQFVSMEYHITPLTQPELPKYPNNKKIISNLQIFKKINETLNEPFKTKAYSRAINGISRLNFDLNSKNVGILKQKKIVGDKIYKKIVEFIKTGKIAELQEAVDKYNKYKALVRVKGIGNKFAKKLIDQGIDNLQKLKQNYKLLNKLQLLGLKYYSDFNTKIPRAEITELIKNLSLFLDLTPTICGSYRRGADYSGDIDLILTLESILTKYNNTQNLIEKLQTWQYHIDILTHGNKKISFIIKSPISNLIRQIDIILIPKKYYYASLIYFTGNKEFNERIRGLAKKRGLRLNEYYLQNVKTKEIQLLRSEREIFDILGINYLTPQQRI